MRFSLKLAQSAQPDEKIKKINETTEMLPWGHFIEENAPNGVLKSKHHDE
jgi:hypothetical protein